VEDRHHRAGRAVRPLDDVVAYGKAVAAWEVPLDWAVYELVWRWPGLTAEQAEQALETWHTERSKVAGLEFTEEGEE